MAADPIDQPMQTEYLTRPDPSRPDWYFLDGDFTVRLETLPAAGPVWLAGESHSFLLALFQLLVFVVAERFDRRWKVVVYRQPRRRPSLPRIVRIDFAPSQEAADALRKDMLAKWRSGEAAEQPPIGARARGRARRAR